MLDKARRGTLPGMVRTGATFANAAAEYVIERWLASFDGSTRTRNKLLIQLHGILGRARKVYGLQGNAVAEVEKFPQKRS